MQQLDDSIGSVNGNIGVPSVIGCNCKHDDNYLLQSLKKRAKCIEVSQLSTSIAQHGELMIAVARLAAMEQEKNQSETHLSRRGFVMRIMLSRRRFAVSLISM
jgi:hypothetical protein